MRKFVLVMVSLLIVACTSSPAPISKASPLSTSTPTILASPSFDSKYQFPIYPSAKEITPIPASADLAWASSASPNVVSGWYSQQTLLPTSLWHYTCFVTIPAKLRVVASKNSQTAIVSFTPSKEGTLITLKVNTASSPSDCA